MTSDQAAALVIADALYEDYWPGDEARETVERLAVMALAALRAAGHILDEPGMIAALREAGYLVLRPTFPPDPPQMDDPVVLARRIGLRVAGDDEIVVSREALDLHLDRTGDHWHMGDSIAARCDYCNARASLRAALSEPQPKPEGSS